MLLTVIALPLVYFLRAAPYKAGTPLPAAEH
jgi:hypothetical protein